MAAALEQIRQMEDAEKYNKPQENMIKEFITKGEYVYQLFSILIHSGSAMGGHYYAYIRSFEDGAWYNFNDSHVTRIADAEVTAKIQEMYGGGANGATSSYMLQYRKFDTNLSSDGDENMLDIKIGDDLIPDYLVEDINQATEKLIAEQLALEEKLL